MSERRVIVDLTVQQAKALLDGWEWLGWKSSPPLTDDERALDQALAEIDSALAVYDATQHPRLAAVPNVDAGSLIEHDASHADPYHYPERGE